jgi:hypothetical protein
MEETGFDICSKVSVSFSICVIKHDATKTQGGLDAMPVPRIDPRFIGRLACSVVTIQTVLSRLHLFVVRVYKYILPLSQTPIKEKP